MTSIPQILGNARSVPEGFGGSKIDAIPSGYKNLEEGITDIRKGIGAILSAPYVVTSAAVEESMRLLLKGILVPTQAGYTVVGWLSQIRNQVKKALSLDWVPNLMAGGGHGHDAHGHGADAHAAPAH